MSSRALDAVRVARGFSRVLIAQLDEIANVRPSTIITNKIINKQQHYQSDKNDKPDSPPVATPPSSTSSSVPTSQSKTSSDEHPPSTGSAAHTHQYTSSPEKIKQNESQHVVNDPQQGTSKQTTDEQSTWIMRERAVPESPVSRVLAFGGLGVGLLAGAAAETARRAIGVSMPSTDQNKQIYSAFVSDANAERLASSLSRMRGAALKLGQMLSIQDDAVIPPVVLKALERVRQGADIMPSRQLSRVLSRELGDDWRSKLVEFEDAPIAAASIGQVHLGKLQDDQGQIVDSVFKIQYPGVARSIKSDLNNLKRLVTVGNFIPENFYLDEALRAAEEELERECNYEIEASNQQKYRDLVLAAPSLRDEFYVPKVYTSHSTKHVLASEFVRGVPIDRLANKPADVRNRVGNSMLRLAMSELFVFGFQQSDPNWSNYLYDEQTGMINLIDFGAARDYSEEFLIRYLALIRACAERDRDGVLEHSITLGFLTGEETKDMFDAHVNASFAVGEPFQKQHRESGFDFTKNDIPARAAKFGKVMLQYRLTPPPKEAYSLHRRLSGAFLMSTKLGSTVYASEMLEEIIEQLKQQGRIEA